jgi:formylglycine-generating enzyme required for sulfatase activity
VPPTTAEVADRAAPEVPIGDVPTTARVPGYEVLDVLGRGGMGVVYKARHLRLNRVVALKMILHAGHAGPEEHFRFLREAEAIAAIRHPGVVQVYDFGTHDGAPFFALEFCEGGSLAKKLSGKPLPPREAADLAEQVARAVQAAHALGIVHRDLKPGNVLLTAAGAGGDTSSVSVASSARAGAARPSASGLASLRETTKVTDFGLARRLDGGSGLTQTDQVMGTPSYMAPEQARASREAGPPADVYAIGAILYECLTGRPPFVAATAFETLSQVMTEEPLPPRSLNAGLERDLETVCLKCLHKDPTRRYESAAALADDLRRWLDGEPILARPAGLAERAVKWARRRPGAAAGLCGALTAVAAVLALAVVASYQWQKAEGALQRADEEKQRADELQRRRALAQIDALRDAAPGAVPGILDNLQESRGEVLPRLRERHAAEQNPAKKARLALALLPVEPDEVRGDLVRAMLAAEDPAEAVLIRDTLRPHADGLSEGLWHKAGAEEAEVRFRALTALAAFDPGDARWKEVAPKLVDDLLGRNPLHLGTCVLALEPVSASLYEPLGRVFRDERPESAAQREAAAQALRLYLTRKPDPETLYALLLDSDKKQYALLRPLLERHKEEAAARMSAELERQPDYWKDEPLDASKALAAGVVAEVEKAGGIVAQRWALCQALSLGRLAAVTEAMGAAGYRPLSVRPWSSAPLGDGDRAALVWTRDGHDWKLDVGLSLEELKDRDAHWQKAGLIPDNVAAYATTDGERYVGLWRRAAEGEKAVLYAGVSAEKHMAQTDVFKAGGYVPARVQTITDADGSKRFAGVWWKGEGKVEDWRIHGADDEGLHAGLAADCDRLLLDVSVGLPPPPRPLRETWLADLKKAMADEAAKPGDLNALYRRGVALFNLGRDGEALKAFDTFLAKGKGVMSHRYRALLRAKAGDAARAQEDLAAFDKVSTNRLLVASATALVGVYLGDPAALKKLDEAVKADGKNSALAYEAACAYARAAERAVILQTAWVASQLGSPSLPALAARPEPGLEVRYAGRAAELLRLAVSRGYGDFAQIQSNADLEAIRGHAGYCEMLRRNGLMRRYSTVWRSDATRQAESPHGLPPAEHLGRCRELAAKGYRPAALSLASLPQEKTPLAASVWHRPVVQADKDALASRQATAATTLLTLKQTEQVWPLFRHSPDPTRRSYLVWRAGERGADPKLLIERLLKEKDTSARRALILALGEFDEKALPADVRAPVVKALLWWYRGDPDPGVHAAISWLLRHKTEGPTPRLLNWGQAQALDAIDKELAGKEPCLVGNAPRSIPAPGDGAGWYVNGQGQTMVMIRGPVEFRMGSPSWEPAGHVANDRPHLRHIPRSYALASTAVTVAQWQRFLKDNPDVPGDHGERYSPESSCPINRVSWHVAARYCNWLSEKEGIPESQWCYTRKTVREMRPHPDYLRRTGYRLPSEAELEYAIRAGSEQRRYYGSVLDLLPRYAHFQGNSKDRSWPVGQKRPNDLGLSDGHGNVWTWCGDAGYRYPQRRSAMTLIDSDDWATVDESKIRPLRGGSFIDAAPLVRSSGRNFLGPVTRHVWGGLRVCRTLPAGSFGP